MKSKKIILFIFGTRPEAVKLAPVIRAFQEDGALGVRICVTAQHRELLDQVLKTFWIVPDMDLDLMSAEQSVTSVVSKIVDSAAGVFERLKPDLVFVQGDTATAFAASLAASLCRIPVAHVEAGLRSHRKSSPFPEEIHRVLIGRLADLHFAPSEAAAENLRKEGVFRGVHVVGNPVVDTLKLILEGLKDGDETRWDARFRMAKPKGRIILLTIHRRESFGSPLIAIFNAIREIAREWEGIDLFFPVHPNRNVRDTAYEQLADIANLHLLEPLSYEDFIWLLCRASLVISDSGGVLEEAVTLGVPVVVVREVTERVDAISGGHARLAGISSARIVDDARAFLHSSPAQAPREKIVRDTFGDGCASLRIVHFTKHHLLGRSENEARCETGPSEPS